MSDALSDAPIARSSEPVSRPASRRRLERVLVMCLVALLVVGAFFLMAERRGLEGVAPSAEPTTPWLENGMIRYPRSFAEREQLAFAEVGRNELTPSIVVSGEVTWDPRRVAAIGARIEGRVRSVPHVEGERVLPGEVLAELESVELGQAQAAVLKARAREQVAKTDAERERRLADAKVTAERDAEHAAANAQAATAERIAAEKTVEALGGAVGGEVGVLRFARQLVTERLRDVEADLPAFASTPALAPVSTGMGEIYVFVVRSETGQHTPMQLRTLLDWEIVPRIRSVPGVIEVNTMGGELKQYQVVTSPKRLRAFGVTLSELKGALERASSSVGAGYVERAGESYLVRGNGRLVDEADIARVLVATVKGKPILVQQLGEVKVGAAIRYGVTTRDGEGEVVTGTAMMLLGANSRVVTRLVKERVAEVQGQLPPGVVIDTIYDRSDFVDATVRTVLKNLLEGALVVLALLLGTVRGAFAVVLGIPASMAVAVGGMHLFGVPGDLMSLGAIDFGFLVDGPIVMLEAGLVALAGKRLLTNRALESGFIDATTPVAKPVAFSVAIIMLVYLPLLALQGVEGKMFRPMATVMACALLGAVIYSVVFFPGMMALLVRPPKTSGPKWLNVLAERYHKTLPFLVERRWLLIGVTTVALLGFGFGFALLQKGADFVPRVKEGDIVGTIRRPPSIGLEEARALDLKAERVLRRFPEVITTLAFTGRAELAFDPVGNDNTDLFVRLKPESEWTSARDLDDLSEKVKHAIESEVAGSFVSVSQPIEDRTNEMISGSRADVAIQLFGSDLDVLAERAGAVAAVVRLIDGTGDVRVERLLGMPNLTFTPDRERLARYGVRLDDAFQTLEAARVGAKVGTVYDGPRRFEVRVLTPPRANSREGLADLLVETGDAELVKLDELGSIEESEGPATVRREGFQRTVRIEVNLRGRDLASWVAEARQRVASEVPLPSAYSVTWGGQFENLPRAQDRLALVVGAAHPL